MPSTAAPAQAAPEAPGGGLKVGFERFRMCSVVVIRFSLVLSGWLELACR